MVTSDVENAAQSGNEEAEAAGTGQGRLASATDKVRQTANEAYEAARQRSTALYGSARERASTALETTRQRTAQGLDTNPIAALVGGLAVGAVLAALLPRTRQEDAALGPLGSRISDSARDAAKAARDAGKDKLQEMGLTPEGARERFGAIASSASDTLRSSASAAVGSVRKKKIGS